MNKHKYIVQNCLSGIFRNGILASALILFGFGQAGVHGAKVAYIEDDTDFENPERGFWKTSVSRKYIPLTTHGALSKEFLDGLDKLFDGVRKAKMKIVPRFSYSNVDAPVPAMLAQIEQLKPILQKHYDVIAVLEAGFIGRWGEWHSSPNVKENESRKAVLFKLLEAMPKERMVAVRYNMYKRAIFGSNEPLTAQEAFSGSNKARTGNHNDCFVTNESDAGTYRSLNSMEGMGLGYEAEKTYLSQDNLFVPQDGETCQVGSIAYASCDRALAELTRMRWDMLNNTFHEGVLSQWKKQGCYEQISKRLGYRLVMTDGTFDDDVTTGDLNINLQLKNVGFGKIYNPRSIELVMRNSANGSEHVFPLPVDPRFWSPGMSHSLVAKIGIPKTVPFGKYDLFLSLQDPAPNLKGIPEYAIRLANKDVWELAKGYNSLKHSVKISSHSANPATTTGNLRSLEKRSRLRITEGMTGKGSIEVSFTNAKSTRVRVDVLDIFGRVIQTLVDSQLEKGNQEFIWNRGSNIDGIYFISVRRDNDVEHRKVVIR